MKNRLVFAFYEICVLCQALLAGPPDLILAHIYHDEVDVTQYLVSEKYDGVRACWDGRKLVSRRGNTIHAPSWFTEGFPSCALDGELWLGRGQFEALLSIVSKSSPIEEEWKQVRYMVFELPSQTGTFEQRYHKMKFIKSRCRSEFLIIVEQQKLKDGFELKRKLENVVSSGGEGLMLHRRDAQYHTGRSTDLLKLKPYFDDEARVVAHHPGKGKYKGMLGSIEVETEQGVRFCIGTGFCDKERKNPPPIGSIVTFKYHGWTSKGKPRFPSFLRIRHP
ncbi:MAG: DNA ligase [Acidobacteria bacterium]|nr:MAG: DNA ligase [Acidobacteriota bacterium]